MNANTLISRCAIAISTDNAPEWIELIPAGKFSAADGRGPFENADPDSVVAASLAKMPPVGLVLDYDHSTDLAAPEGRPAPAAGWLKQFKVDNGAIFARVEWTIDAAEAIKARKYRYVSPVFEHSKDGKIERILRAALTNNPALINLPALAQSEDAGFLARQPRAGMTEGTVLMAKEGEGKMKLSEVLAALEKAYPEASPERLMKAAACLMADDDGDDDDDINADEDDPYENETEDQMAARHAEEITKCTSDDERAAMASCHAAEKERMARRVRGLEVENRNEKSVGAAQRNRADQSARSADQKSEIVQLVARHPMVVKMASDLNSMRVAQAKQAAIAKVDAAIREGRLIPSQREWAIEYCTADSRGFAKFIGTQPKILQSGPDGIFSRRIGEAPKGIASLSEREVEIFANLGLETKEQLEKCAAVKEKWTLKFPRPRLLLDDTNSGRADGGAAQ
ncbi:MAG TPA: phage protease [Candidatus Binataceae bacterium]|nr:phage protease [Candidatus Binataceae bacterium]